MVSGNQSSLRVFGLLAAIALITFGSYRGLSGADVQGTLLGFKIVLVGPVAAFFATSLLIHWIGLFKWAMATGSEIPRASSGMTAGELEDLLDLLVLRRNGLDRQQRDVRAMLESSRDNHDYEVVVAAGGFRPVHRPGR